ncbi:hypothetical protein BU25DRAFT_187859 [Macroventuria anomochaeta]|uniref:Uncharacterized protein n=1 Tax=Macroventuria anomochaeta TaxID=301207 RepID=A0ACB6SB69_9PLEO|nr:uncharacterized protein BU25DRAFT_187859 [Macroventuria anomochaeta]KAF2631456.1 hypothetical protein BU25DRAFT_187859 [Macroventuria anomochaeta]
MQPSNTCARRIRCICGNKLKQSIVSSRAACSRFSGCSSVCLFRRRGYRCCQTRKELLDFETSSYILGITHSCRHTSDTQLSEPLCDPTGIPLQLNLLHCLLFSFSQHESSLSWPRRHSDTQTLICRLQRTIVTRFDLPEPPTPRVDSLRRG